MVEWSWSDKLGSRSRRPACLVITRKGDIYRFTGSDIEGVVKVVNSNYVKQGKWSHTTFHCISPEGTKIYSWSQSWGEGLFWPQASWEEAIAEIQNAAPQAKAQAVENVIRENWPHAAGKFDENRAAMHAFAGVEGPMEWTWNDGLASRSRRPACLIITPQGDVYRFEGGDIEGVVKVTKEDYEKNGKWSNSTYHCVSPSGSIIYSWRQSWEEGLFWPQASWEEAITEVQQEAPQAKPEAIEAIIREHWSRAAEKFDENRAAMQAFS
ncbi:hypothetical protein GF360_03700 [candidate division WWE3 bacterium]|nr:hypothetical protein [candidate division WWE3 bacterium]